MAVSREAPPTIRYRRLLHVDLDAFQVSAERLRDPALAGIPVIVGGDGDPSRPRQVVTCASYEARAVGVHAGLPLPAARRKCPEATFVPLDLDYYTGVPERVMETIRSLGHPLEVWGFDEGYLGVDPREEAPTVDDAGIRAVAHRIVETVRTTTGLDCCVGVSDNKQRAKAATGFAKTAVRDPAAGDADRVFVLDETNWADLMGPRPCRDLWSVGPRTAAKLTEAGVETVDQLRAVERADLTAWFGPHQGDWLYVLCRGGGDDTIAPEPAPARSHSRSRTFPTDLVDREEIRAAAAELLREVLEQVVAEDRLAVRAGLTVRTSTFHTRTKMRKLPAPTVDRDAIAGVLSGLVDAFDLDRPVRLLGVRLELE